MNVKQASDTFYNSDIGKECKNLRKTLDELHFFCGWAARKLNMIEALLMTDIINKEENDV